MNHRGAQFTLNSGAQWSSVIHKVTLYSCGGVQCRFSTQRWKDRQKSLACIGNNFNVSKVSIALLWLFCFTDALQVDIYMKKQEALQSAW